MLHRLGVFFKNQNLPGASVQAGAAFVPLAPLVLDILVVLS